MLSAVYNVGGLSRGWPDLGAVVEPWRPRGVDRDDLLRCVIRHGARQWADVRGARAGWPYTDTTAVADLIDRALLAALDGRDGEVEVSALRARLLELRVAPYGPFGGCRQIWVSAAMRAFARSPLPIW